MTRQVEPEFDDANRRQMLALTDYEASLCPLCGLPRHICRAAANEFRFVAEEPERCFVETARLRAQEKYGEGMEQPGAVLWGARLKT